jgi:hypothetical protein
MQSNMSHQAKINNYLLRNKILLTPPLSCNKRCHTRCTILSSEDNIRSSSDTVSPAHSQSNQTFARNVFLAPKDVALFISSTLCEEISLSSGVTSAVNSIHTLFSRSFHTHEQDGEAAFISVLLPLVGGDADHERGAAAGVHLQCLQVHSGSEQADHRPLLPWRGRVSGHQGRCLAYCPQVKDKLLRTCTQNISYWKKRI